MPSIFLPVYSYLWWGGGSRFYFPFLPACFPCSFIHLPLVARSSACYCCCCSNKLGVIPPTNLQFPLAIHTQFWQSSCCSAASGPDPIFSARAGSLTQCVAEKARAIGISQTVSVSLCGFSLPGKLLPCCIAQWASILLWATRREGNALRQIYLSWFAFRRNENFAITAKLLLQNMQTVW